MSSKSLSLKDVTNIAAEELLKLLESEEDFSEFLKFSMQYYIHGKHLEILSDALQKVESGEIKRLMIFSPPRHGKSETATIRFPAWYLGRNPQKQVIACSYSGGLATSASVATRQLVESDKWKRIWKHEPTSKGAVKWQFSCKENKRANYLSAGVGGGITGEGADLLIIDDPIKNAEEANSITYREKTWNWYLSTAYTRVHPDGAIIIILTRWHHDDLAGRLLKLAEQNPNADQWHVVHLKAIDEEGRVLWPERWPLKRIEAIRESVGSRVFNALYQGMPSADEGNLFRREWWSYYNLEEMVLNEEHPYIIQTWDTAVKTGKSNDYTVGMTFLSRPNGIYILNMTRAKVEFPDAKRMIINNFERYQPSLVLIEDAASGPSIIQDLRVSTNIPLLAVRPEGDKVSRANSITATIEGGRVFIPRDAPWTETLIEETACFPSGEHDDIVDALGMGIRFLTHESRSKMLGVLGGRGANLDDYDGPMKPLNI